MKGKVNVDQVCHELQESSGKLVKVTFYKIIVQQDNGSWILGRKTNRISQTRIFSYIPRLLATLLVSVESSKKLLSGQMTITYYVIIYVFCNLNNYLKLDRGILAYFIKHFIKTLNFWWVYKVLLAWGREVEQSIYKSINSLQMNL